MLGQDPGGERVIGEDLRLADGIPVGVRRPSEVASVLVGGIDQARIDERTDAMTASRTAAGPLPWS